MKNEPTIKYIVDVKRIAGYTTMPPPPQRMVGKRVKIDREITRWHAYWVKYRNEDYVLTHAELFDGTKHECDCNWCKIMQRKRHGGKNA